MHNGTSSYIQFLACLVFFSFFFFFTKLDSVKNKKNNNNKIIKYSEVHTQSVYHILIAMDVRYCHKSLVCQKYAQDVKRKVLP